MRVTDSFRSRVFSSQAIVSERVSFHLSSLFFFSFHSSSVKITEQFRNQIIQIHIKTPLVPPRIFSGLLLEFKNQSLSLF
ncbi:hypothetical protein VNO78_25174 [Psophocarpus tetragonolobus]|uniref:Uncharacterized protein n=1 Tax=Psophocarpus tetragonolobus TaxID=3891 RepID=A0AAN9XET7_PSOTE